MPTMSSTISLPPVGTIAINMRIMDSNGRLLADLNQQLSLRDDESSKTTTPITTRDRGDTPQQGQSQSNSDATATINSASTIPTIQSFNTLPSISTSNRQQCCEQLHQQQHQSRDENEEKRRVARRSQCRVRFDSDCLGGDELNANKHALTGNGEPLCPEEEEELQNSEASLATSEAPTVLASSCKASNATPQELLNRINTSLDRIARFAAEQRQQKQQQQQQEQRRGQEPIIGYQEAQQRQEQQQPHPPHQHQQKQPFHQQQQQQRPRANLEQQATSSDQFSSLTGGTNTQNHSLLDKSEREEYQSDVYRPVVPIRVVKRCWNEADELYYAIDSTETETEDTDEEQATEANTALTTTITTNSTATKQFEVNGNAKTEPHSTKTTTATASTTTNSTMSAATHLARSISARYQREIIMHTIGVVIDRQLQQRRQQQRAVGNAAPCINNNTANGGSSLAERWSNM